MSRRKSKLPTAPSELEETLLLQLRLHKLPLPEREYAFHPTRKYRFDFAYPEQKLAIECEGGIYSSGRHNRGAGYEEDLEKYHEALRLGWTVYRCSWKLINSLRAVELITELLTPLQK